MRAIPFIHFYLVYFVDDATVLVVNRTQIVECVDGMVKPGGNCHVKEIRKLYEGQVITYGKQ